jgi:hypothetical protein
MARYLWLALAACGRLHFDSVATDGRDGSLDGHASDAGAAANFMFMSSTVRAAGSLGGLAGADALCQQLASAAGIGDNTYRAWLSTSTVNAKDRLGTARGWVRRDGVPFADTQADLLATGAMYPPMLDENGVPWTNFTLPYVVTATDSSGMLVNGPANTCSDWTDTAGGGPGYGTPFSRGLGWTGGIGVLTSCDAATHIFCFGIDRQVAVVAPTVPGRRAFITASTFDPTTGIAGADTACANDATAANLTGSYRALLATPTASARSRFVTTGAPWYRLDGVEVTADLATMLAPLATTATADYGAGQFPFTGASDPGQPGLSATTCAGWTSKLSTDHGEVGNAASVASWFGVATVSCDVGGGVYCFEQ